MRLLPYLNAPCHVQGAFCVSRTKVSTSAGYCTTMLERCGSVPGMRLVLSNRYCERKHWRWVWADAPNSDARKGWCRTCEVEAIWQTASDKGLRYSGTAHAVAIAAEQARMIESMDWPFRIVTDA